MIETVKKLATMEEPDVLIGYLINGTLNVPLSSGNRDYNEVLQWIDSETIIGTPESENYSPETGTPASEDWIPDSDPLVGTPPSIDWVAQVGTPASEDYEVISHIVEEAFSFEENKNNKIIILSQEVDAQIKPEVFVLLQDGITEIYIWGSREDQFDIKDRYELMVEDSIPSINIRDSSNNIMLLGHADIKRCYKAITIHRQNVIEYQWTKEAEIMACTTQAELDAITWTIP